MRAVDLRPPEARRRLRLHRNDPALLLVLAVAVLAAAALAAGAVAAQRHADSARTRLADARLELRQQASAAPRLRTIAVALSGRAAWDRVLREVALALPPGVALTGLSLRADGTVVIRGRAGSPAAVQALVTALGRVRELAPGALAERKGGGFELHVVLRGAAR